MLLLLVHVTALLLALLGDTVAVNFSVFPFTIVVLDFNPTLLTATDAGLITVTLHVVVFPLFDFAVIVAVPAFTAVTFPFTSTLATLLLLLVHVIVLLLALLGDTVAVNL